MLLMAQRAEISGKQYNTLVESVEVYNMQNEFNANFQAATALTNQERNVRRAVNINPRVLQMTGREAGEAGR
jgi:hypothetical protein